MDLKEKLPAFRIQPKELIQPLLNAVLWTGIVLMPIRILLKVKLYTYLENLKIFCTNSQQCQPTSFIFLVSIMGVIIFNI
jgi:hypothetical protein